MINCINSLQVARTKESDKLKERRKWMRIRLSMRLKVWLVYSVFTFNLIFVLYK